MVNITVKTSKDKVISISAIGHANYAPNGQDIVCSAISAVLAGGFNALQGKHKIKIQQSDSDSFTLFIDNQDFRVLASMEKNNYSNSNQKRLYDTKAPKFKAGKALRDAVK